MGGALEYNDCLSEEGLNSHNECSMAQMGGAVEYSDCLSEGVKLSQWVFYGPDVWGCRIQRLHLWRGLNSHNEYSMAQMGRAVEYNDCLSEEGLNSHNECSMARWVGLLNTMTASLKRVRLSQWVFYSPDGWGCRIQRLHLWRGLDSHNDFSIAQMAWGCRIQRLPLWRGLNSHNECSMARWVGL